VRQIFVRHGALLSVDFVAASQFKFFDWALAITFELVFTP
jgi:hypothetical protein